MIKLIFNPLSAKSALYRLAEAMNLTGRQFRRIKHETDLIGLSPRQRNRAIIMQLIKKGGEQL